MSPSQHALRDFSMFIFKMQLTVTTFEPVEFARMVWEAADRGTGRPADRVTVPAVLHTLEDLSNEGRWNIAVPAGIVSQDTPDD